MSKVWEIPAREQHEYFVLIEEDKKNKFEITENDFVFEITKVDKAPYFTQSPGQSMLGSLHEVTTSEEGTHIRLGSDWGAGYEGAIENLHRPLNTRSRFVSSSLLHKGRWIMRAVRVEFRRDVNIDNWEIPVYLPLLRLHRPHLNGCTAEATVKTKNSIETTSSFEFVGMNGGAGLGFEIELSATYNAATICKEEAIPATLIAEHGATLVDDQPVAYGVRYRIENIDLSGRVTRNIPPEIDNCEKTPSPIPNPKPQFWGTFDKTKIPSTTEDTDKEGIKLGSTDYVSVGLGSEAGSIPLKVSVEMKRTQQWEYEVLTTLKGGAKYLRFPVASSTKYSPFEICWSILKKVG